MGAMVTYLSLSSIIQHYLAKQYACNYLDTECGVQVGSLLSGLLLRTLGRRHTIIISAVLFLVSFLCIGN